MAGSGYCAEGETGTSPMAPATSATVFDTLLLCLPLIVASHGTDRPPVNPPLYLSFPFHFTNVNNVNKLPYLTYRRIIYKAFVKLILE